MPSWNPFQPRCLRYGNLRYDHGSTCSATKSAYSVGAYLQISLPSKSTTRTLPS